jgi:hypothetical protein
MPMAYVFHLEVRTFMPNCAALLTVVLSCPVAGATGEPPSHAVRLAGSPQEIGQIWGTINRAAITRDIQTYYLGKAKDHNLSRETLVERSRTFIRIAREIAPHWLLEAESIAAAAGVDKDLYVSFIASVHRNLFLNADCTSYAASRRFTEGNRIFFHKNRDNAPRAQSAFVIRSSISGVNKFIAVSDASVLACMMMVNEKGLAGSADTGGLPVNQPRYAGLMNTFILRHIAEKADTCAAALGIIQEFVRKGYYAGGAKTGTHWLFVDRQSTILEVSNNSQDVSFKYHQEKVYFSTRRDSAAARRLREAAEPIGLLQFHRVSRDPSICFASSISGMTIEIDGRYPDLLTRAWISMPATSISFPLFMGQAGTPLCLVNGQADALGRRVNDKSTSWETAEKKLYASQMLVEDKVLALLKNQGIQESKNLLEAWSGNMADAHSELLRSLIRP